MHFTFGNKDKVDNKFYKENGSRFAGLTQHCKLRFAVGEKLDLHFGLQMMDKRTYKKAEHCTNGKAIFLAERCMNAAEYAILEILFLVSDKHPGLFC